VKSLNKEVLQSAALGLIHELGHAARISVSLDPVVYEDKIINGIEKQWALYYNEPIRTSHFGQPRDPSMSSSKSSIFTHDKCTTNDKGVRSC